MIRLDSLALKAFLSWTKEIYRHPEHTLIKEKLTEKANALWNISTTILRRDEPFGNEAIHLMRVVAYLQSNKLFWAHAMSDDCFVTLRNHNLVSTDIAMEWMGGPLRIHPFFYDVICERNGSHEVDILRTCLNTANPLYKNLTIISLKQIWEKALMYPELVHEFKSVGLDVCIKCYRSYYSEEGLSIAKKTAQIFEEQFGPTDDETLLLMSYEFRVITLLRELNQLDLQKKCKEIRPKFEEYIRATRGGHSRTLDEIYKAELKVQAYALKRKYVAEDFLTESILFYTSIAIICKHSSEPDQASEWLDMCNEYLLKMPSTNTTLELIQKLRIMILSDETPIHDQIIESASLAVLTVTLFDLLTSDNAKKSIEFKKNLSEELFTHLEIFRRWFLRTSVMECTKNTIEEFIALMRIAWGFIHRLTETETMDQLLSVLESTNKMLQKMLDVKKNKFRLLCREYFEDNWEILFGFHEDIFETATTGDFDKSLKNQILEQSLISGKYLLAASIRLKDKEQISQWIEYIEKCCLELNSFEEYENCLLQYTLNGQNIAGIMIEFGYNITQKLKLTGTQTQDKAQLIQTALASARKYLNILSDEDMETSRE